MRRRRKKRVRIDCIPTAAVAFGLGLILALFCSVKLALIIAAIIIIYFGICLWPC